MEVCYHNLHSEPQYALVKEAARSLGTRLALIAGEQFDRCSKNQAAPGTEAATEMTADAGFVPAVNPYL